MVSAETKRVSLLVLIVGPVVTLAISPWSSFDPINPIKLVTLATLTSYMLAIALITILRMGMNSFWSQLSSQQRAFVLYTILFLFTLNIPLLFSDAPLSQQLWGVFGRNTGLITYVCLALLGLVVSLNFSEKLFNRSLSALYFTSFANSIYCLIQIFGSDPIGWSSFAPFGTLGNVNFLSAFLGIATVVLLIDKVFFNSGSARVFWSILALVQVFIVAETDSVQGLFVIGLGLLTTLFLWVWKKFSFRKLIFLIFALMAPAGLVFFGLFDKGPLGKILFQQTNVFRLDYWNAAIKMLVNHPLTGVGLDSYGDWYFAERGFITAFRTGPNRTSNSAHNIFLDVASGGGIFLLSSFIAVFFLVLRFSFSYMRKMVGIDKTFVAMFCGWIGFVFQSLVSINQIGVSVWGWIMSGLLISYVSQTSRTSRANAAREQVEISNRARHKVRKTISSTGRKTLSQSTAISSLLAAALIGWAVSPVYSLDASFKRALSTQDQQLLLEVVSNRDANSFLVSKLVESKLSVGDYAGVKSATDTLSSRFPRDHYGYRVAMLIPGTSVGAQAQLLEKVRDLDPFGACVEADAVSQINTWFNQVTDEQRVELLRWWGLVDWSYKGNFSEVRLDEERYFSKLTSFCP